MDKRGLIFPLKGLIDECEALKAYARDVLDKKTLYALSEAKSRLENFQASKSTNPVRWGIPEDQPLCTIWSDGESQPEKRSKHKIRAKFSFVWEIRKLDEGKWKNKHLLLDGIASTVTTIVDEVDGVGRDARRRHARGRVRNWATRSKRSTSRPRGAMAVRASPTNSAQAAGELKGALAPGPDPHRILI